MKLKFRRSPAEDSEVSELKAEQQKLRCRARELRKLVAASQQQREVQRAAAAQLAQVTVSIGLAIIPRLRPAGRGDGAGGAGGEAGAAARGRARGHRAGAQAGQSQQHCGPRPGRAQGDCARLRSGYTNTAALQGWKSYCITRTTRWTWRSGWPGSGGGRGWPGCGSVARPSPAWPQLCLTCSANSAWPGPR